MTLQSFYIIESHVWYFSQSATVQQKPFTVFSFCSHCFASIIKGALCVFGEETQYQWGDDTNSEILIFSITEQGPQNTVSMNIFPPKLHSAPLSTCFQCTIIYVYNVVIIRGITVLFFVFFWEGRREGSGPLCSNTRDFSECRHPGNSFFFFPPLWISLKYCK